MRVFVFCFFPKSAHVANAKAVGGNYHPPIIHECVENMTFGHRILAITKDPADIAMPLLGFSTPQSHVRQCQTCILERENTREAGLKHWIWTSVDPLACRDEADIFWASSALEVCDSKSARHPMSSCVFQQDTHTFTTTLCCFDLVRAE